MSVTKTGWVIAAATAAAFAAGCAGQGQGHNDNMGASCAGEPAVAATHGCKNVAECKMAKAKVKHHHKKMVKEVAEASKDAPKEEGDAAK